MMNCQLMNHYFCRTSFSSSERWISTKLRRTSDTDALPPLACALRNATPRNRFHMVFGITIAVVCMSSLLRPSAGACFGVSTCDVRLAISHYMMDHHIYKTQVGPNVSVRIGLQEARKLLSERQVERADSPALLGA